MAQQPFIVGIAGKKRHGKDTVGEILAQEEFGFHRTAFALMVKVVAMDLFWLSYDQCFGGPGIDREEIDPRWGLSPRQILQRIGTEMGRNTHPDVWVRNTLRLIEQAYEGESAVNLHLPRERTFLRVKYAPGKADRWAVTDVRFVNEARGIREAGGVIVKVVRPGLEDSGDTHASETSVDLVEEDYLIVNDGTLEDLKTKISRLPFLDCLGTSIPIKN